MTSIFEQLDAKETPSGKDDDVFARLDAGRPPERGSLLESFGRGLKNTAAAGQIAATNDQKRIAELVAERARDTPAPSEAMQQIASEAAPGIKAWKEAQTFGEHVSAGADVGGTLIKNLVTHPTDTAHLLAENLPYSAPGMAASIAGAVAGGVVAGPPGALAGGLAGGFAGAYPVEQGATMQQLVQELADANKVDINDTAAMLPLIEQNYPKMLEQSRLKGAGTAGVDAVLTRLTFGLGQVGERALAAQAKTVGAALKAGSLDAAQASAQLGAIEAKIAARATLPRTMARGAAMTLGEMAGESASEAAGQKLAFGEVDPIDVGMEGLLSLPQGAGMAAAGKLTDKALGINGEDSMAALKQQIGNARTMLDAMALQAGQEQANADFDPAFADYAGAPTPPAGLLTHGQAVPPGMIFTPPAPPSLTGAAAQATGTATGPADAGGAAEPKQIPFADRQAAQAYINSYGAAQGAQFQIVPHPRVQGRFAVVPKPPKEDANVSGKPANTPAQALAPSGKGQGADAGGSPVVGSQLPSAVPSAVGVSAQGVAAGVPSNEPVPAPTGRDAITTTNGESNAKAAKTQQAAPQQQEAATGDLTPYLAKDASGHWSMAKPAPNEATRLAVIDEMDRRNKSGAIDAAAHTAATSPNNDLPQPTEAQKEAGNYQKGHVTVQGLPISIENPAGSVRDGKDASGKPWQTTMQHHYGYIKGTIGKDKDHLDVFFGPEPETSPAVFVIDQINPATKNFDEHKIIIGAKDIDEAKAIYRANYAKGWQGMGAISTMPIAGFKEWLKSGDTTKPMVYRGRPVKKVAENEHVAPDVSKEAEKTDTAKKGIHETTKDEVAARKAAGAAPPPLESEISAIDRAAVAGYQSGLSGTDKQPDVGFSSDEEESAFRIGVRRGKDDAADSAKVGAGETAAAKTVEPTDDMQARYAASVQKFNALVGELKQAASTERKAAIKLQMDALDQEQAGIKAELSRKALAAVSAAIREEADKKFGAMTVGTRIGFSEHPTNDNIYWEKTGDNEWTRHGLGSSSVTKTNAEMNGGRVIQQAVIPAESAPTDFDAMFDDVLAEETAVKVDAGKKKLKKAKAEFVAKSATTGLVERGSVGMKLSAGQVVLTASGRKTTPFPSIATDTNRKATATIKLVDRWLLLNALDEAHSRGDNFNRQQFQSIKLDNISQSDKDSAEEYLFGQQPAVVPSILKPLASATKSASKGIASTIDALGALFSTKPGTLGSGPVFNEDTYAAAKPLFAQAVAHFKDAGQDLKEVMRAVVKLVLDKFGAQAAGNMKPYVVRFMQDVQSGNVSYDESKEIGDNDTVPSSGGIQKGQSGDLFGTDRGTRDGAPGATAEHDAGRTGEIGRVPGRGSPDSRNKGAGKPAKLKRIKPDAGADFLPVRNGLTREGSWFDTAKRNVDLIELAIKIQGENRPATAEEQAQLSKYVGFGASAIRNPLFPVPPAYAKKQEPDRLIWSNHIHDARWKALAERLEALPIEWQRSVLQSTQYAHYTSEGIVRSVWDAMAHMGFTGGQVFEPGMGIGSFAMLMPPAIRDNSTYTGVEFDAPTALIAKLLSPQQNMLHDDFIKRKFPSQFFDVAIGNPPFSQTQIYGDPDYEKHGFMLHDFFFAKSIDRVKPGGLLAFVTSKGTMDKQTDKARKYLSERADLLGAIRLPSTAFEDNAGTSVVTDVIFLRKRADGAAPAGESWLNVATVETKDGPVVVNEYFAAHPDMVLGQQRISGNTDDMGRRINSNGRGGEKYTVVSYDATPAELDAKFAQAVTKLPKDVYAATTEAKTDSQKNAIIDFDPSVKREGVIYLSKSGEPMRVDGGVGKPIDTFGKFSDKDKAWFKSYVGLRDLIQQARYSQLHDGKWEADLKALNKAYDEFRKTHGPIFEYTVSTRKTTDDEGNIKETEYRRFRNKKLYSEDYDNAVVLQLEHIAEDGEIKKGPFLSGRTIGMPAVRDVRTMGDAVAVSLNEHGALDIDDIAQRMKLSRTDAIDALGDQIYRGIDGRWQMADEYLSGDVVAKLEEAERAAALDSSLERNVEALKAAQPEKLGPSQISAKLGASWLPVDDVNEFAVEIGAGEVTFDPKTESWQVVGGNVRSGRMAGAEYGTARRSPSELLEAALNSREVKIIDKVDGKSVTDTDGTTAANAMLQKIKDKFKSWVWLDSSRAANLVETYNRRYNNIAPRKFDGSHLTLPGVSLKFNLHPHQLRAIWRIIQTGNTYLAHAVGAGKTIEMIAAGMEQRRLGLIQKPMYVVPNHMLEQFANEFMELYPLANIMVADDENFTAEKRKQFVAAATMNNPDAVIITHDAYQSIGVKEESVGPIRDEILADLEYEMSTVAAGNDGRVRRGQLQQQIEAVTQRFDRIINAGGKNSSIKFEDIGIDFVFADEAHAYRKLDFHTSQQIKGIDPNGSKRAMDMYVKTRYLEKKNPGRSVVFASGTPVTNTMGELYTIMRFFAADMLDRGGISTFDSWSRMFGEAATMLEPNAAGKYELVKRFAKFDNVPELMSRVRQFMDVLTSEHLGSLVKRPNIKGGKPNLNLVESSAALDEYMTGELSRRLEISKKWKQSPDQQNNPDPVIAIIGDGRFAALDPRFFGKTLADGERSVITDMGAKVVATYHETADNVYLEKDGKQSPIKGGTQIVFYNMGFGEQSNSKRGFDARAAFVKILTEGGIPRNQIEWFDEANTDAKKEAVFKAMRSGKVRVLIGSAKKMGTGVNVQNRLAALHYQDPPWYPSDVEQPHGRIIRQGNQHAEVVIEWYSTKGTYQSTMWQMVARKQRFIDQAFSGDKSLRSMDDMGEASLFEQAAAVTSGDPRAMQLAGLKQDIERMERLQSAHASEQINARSALRSANYSLEHSESQVKRFGAAFKSIGERYFSFVTGKVDGRLYDKVGEFGAALKAAFNKVVAGDNFDEDGEIVATIGENIALKVSRVFSAGKATKSFELAAVIGDLELPIATGEAMGDDVDPVGLGRRVGNTINSVSSSLQSAKDSILAEKANITRLSKKLGAPFEHQQEMLEKHAELKRLETELAAEGEAKAAPIVITEDGASANETKLSTSRDSTEALPVDGKALLASITPVSRDSLPNALAAPKGKATRQLYDSLNRIAALFGKRVQFFTGIKDDGFVLEGDSQTIYINVNSGIHHAAILGHELMHLLKREVPQAYAAVARVVRQSLPAGSREKFDAYYNRNAAEGQKLKGTALLEEAVSDLLGNRFTEAQFWTDVFGEVEKQYGFEARGIIQKLSQAVLKIIQKVIAAFEGKKFQTDTMISGDMKAIQSALVKATAQYMRETKARGFVSEATGPTKFSGREGYSREGFAANVLQELASETDLFRYPTTKAGSLKTALHDVFPGATYLGDLTRTDEQDASGADNRYSFQTPDYKAEDGTMMPGKQFDIFTTANRVWVDVHRLKPQDQGSRIYSAVADFAYNTRRVFRGDPAGVSPDAIRARNKMMLSSALKYGTTRHLEASKEQRIGLPGDITPLKWGPNEVENVRNLIHTINTTNQLLAPALKDYRYDFAKRQFTKLGEHDAGTKDILADLGSNDDKRASAALIRAIGGHQRREAGIGAASGRAAILIQSLVSEEGRGTGDGGILQATLNDASALIDGGLRASFSTQRDEIPDQTPVHRVVDGQELRNLRRAAGGIERPQDGVFLYVTEDGKLIATGLKGTKIPPRFSAFAQKHDLIFEARRKLPTSATYQQSGGGYEKSEPLPEEYRDSGAMYAGEMGSSFADRTRFSSSRQGIADTLADWQIKQQWANGIKNRLSDVIAPTHGFNLWHKSVGTQFHKATVNPLFKRAFDAGQRFLDDVSLMVTRAESKAPDIFSQSLGKLGLSAADNAVIGKALTEGTLENGPSPHDGVVFDDATLSSRFGLTVKQIGFYRQARAMIDESLDALAKSEMAQHARLVGADMAKVDALVRADLPLAVVRQYLDTLMPGQDDAVSEALDGILATTDSLKQHGYAPLMRFGKFTVAAYSDSKDKEPSVFLMADTQAEAGALQRQLQASGDYARVTTGENGDAMASLFQGVTPDTLALFVEHSAISRTDAVQEYLRLAVHNRSAMKRMIHRKGVTGYSTDATRTLASFVTSNARKAARNLNSYDMAQAVASIPKEQGGLQEEAGKLMEYVQNPGEQAAKLRGFLFFNYLGGSIAAGIVNLTQPLLMTLPYLARYGVANAASAMTAAMKSATQSLTGKSTGDAKLDAALKRAKEEGITDPKEMYQMMAAANSGAQSFLGYRAMRVWGSNFAVTEAFNRTLTFTAAYRLAQDAKSADPYGDAVRAVVETQGLYNAGNRPNWARSTPGQVIFTFKQYSIAYVEFLRRLWSQGTMPKKQLALALGLLILAAGLEGLPGSDDLDDVIDTVGNWLGYGTNSKKWRREHLTQWLGKGMADLALHGVSGISGFPVDVSARLGVANLLPGTGLANPARPDKVREVAEVFGVTGSLVNSAGTAIKATAQGDGRKAALAMMPTALRNLYMAGEMSGTGEYRDMDGRKVIGATGGDAIIKGIGFQPKTVADVQRQRREIQSDIDIQRLRAEEFSDRMARAIAHDDPVARGQVFKDLTDWNRSNPDKQVRLNPSSIRETVRRMKMDAEQRMIRSAPKTMRAGIREALA